VSASSACHDPHEEWVVVTFPQMKFQAHAKNLRLIQRAGYSEVDNSAGIPIIKQNPQVAIHFSNWFYETEDEDEIVWLKRHKMFSETPGNPSSFWVFVPPRNLEAELAAEKARTAELEAKLAEKVEEAPKPTAKDLAKQAAKASEAETA